MGGGWIARATNLVGSAEIMMARRRAAPAVVIVFRFGLPLWSEVNRVLDCLVSGVCDPRGSCLEEVKFESENSC